MTGSAEDHAARQRRLDDISLRAGVLIAAVLAGLYPVIAEPLGHPLAAMILPTLVAAAIGGPRPTLIVGMLSVVLSLGLGFADPGITGPALLTRIVLELLGVAIGTALAGARRRYEDTLRDVSSTATLLDAFQRGLVPETRIPSALVARSRYVPGEDRMRLGGDFVDLVEVDGGGGAFVLGDVSGHGPAAAAFGSAVRAGWKSLAFAHPTSPVLWLEVLERSFFADRRFDGFVTALAGWADPRTRTIHLVGAGHCWPVVHGPGGSRLVEMPTGVPLGATPNGVWELTSLQLGSEETLLVYTDGLIENRRADPLRRGCGEEGLLRWLAGHRRDGSQVDLDHLLADLGPDGFDDDVAVLALGFSRSVPAAAPGSP